MIIPFFHRRACLIGALASLAPARSFAGASEDDRVRPERALSFPRDHGAHPGARIEWWYATGWLTLPDGSREIFLAENQRLVYYRQGKEMIKEAPPLFRRSPFSQRFAHGHNARIPLATIG